MNRYCVLPLSGILILAFAPPASAQVDLAGEWANVMHEDRVERAPGPEIGDYTGMPLNEAGRRRGESWSPSLLTVPEHQCIPHPANYGAMHSNVRIWKEVDPASQQIIAWHLLHESFNRFRVVYMDGRPRPSEDVMHTWQGFSTGRWVNNMLEITTTHMKAGRIRRNGIEHSDRSTLVEYLGRRGAYLTFVSILDDPATLSEPWIHTRAFRFNPGQVIRPYPCRGVVEVDRALGDVPHYLPGKNPDLGRFAERFGLPLEASLGGAETMYPEYAKKLEAMRQTSTTGPSTEP